ncbi:MAG: hypothetical protein LBC28_00135 [Oscillospiraceae bacterium]|jgi:predicted kinase|nr:hypothetical protein [Oscillospiraceae bacterium]
MKLIIVHSAPGCGKSTVAAKLHEHYKSPWFEFGWIPEFRNLNPFTELPCALEEQISFENLVLVAQNYIGHGFENVLLSDLNDIRILDIAKQFRDTAHIILTLYSEDEDVIKERVLTRENGNTYKDWEQAIAINRIIRGRPPLPNEYRIRTDAQDAEQVTKQAIELIERHSPRLNEDLAERRREEFFSYTD